MLNKILSYADYKFLKVLASNSTEDNSQVLKIYDSIEFKDAPTDSLLLMVSDKSSEVTVTNLDSNGTKVLSGSVLIKLSNETIMKSGLQVGDGKGLVYFDVVHTQYGSTFDSADRQVGLYDLKEVSGKVVLMSSDSVRKMLSELDEKYLNGTFDVAHYVRNANNYEKAVTR